MASVRRIGANICAQVFALAVSAAERVLLVGMIVRLWGPDLFADYAVLQSWAGLLLMAEFGLQVCMQNMQQAAAARGDEAAFRRASALHGGLVWSLCALLAAGGLAALPLAGGLTHSPALADGRALAVLVLLGAASLLQLLRSTATSLYTACGAFARITFIRALVQGAGLAAGVAAVAAGGGPVALAAVFLLFEGAISFVVLSADMRRRFAGRLARPALPARAEWAAIAGPMRWLSLVSVAPQLWLQAPVLLAGLFGPAREGLAAFLLMRTLVNLLRQCFQFAVLGAGLEIAPHAHAGDAAAAWRLTAQGGLLLSVAAGVAAAGVLAFGPGVMAAWSGQGGLYDPALAFWLLLPAVVTAPFQQIMALLQYSQRPRLPGLHKLIQLGFGLALIGPGLALAGMTGLAAALALAEIAATLLMLRPLAMSGLFAGLGGYCLRAGGALLGAGMWAGIVAFAVIRLMPGLVPGATAGLLAGTALWLAAGALPPLLAALPPALRRRLF